MKLNPRFKWPVRLASFLTPLFLGVVVLVVAVKMRTEPAKRDVTEFAQPVRVVTAEAVPIVPRATGYGQAEPRRMWQAVCEVNGRIVEIQPGLQPGSTVAQDELLLRLDDTDVKLAIARLKAEVSRAKASIGELRANEANYKASLRLEEASLNVVNMEMDRLKQLADRNAVSATELDNQQRALLAQQQLVQSVRNKLTLWPSQIESAEAALKVADTNLAERERDLQRLEFRAPFDARIGPVSLELGQFVAIGEKLFSAQSYEDFRIEAEFDSQDLRRLFIETVDAAESRFPVDVIVRYTLGGQLNERSGRFVRFREQLSEDTRSGIVIVDVDWHRKASSGPPPIRGTFCEVELQKRNTVNRIVVTLVAIRDQNSVLVLDEENRLRQRTVDIEFEQDDIVVITSGLVDGEIVVVSELDSGIAGLLVEPRIDSGLQKAIQAAAAGSESAE